MKYRIQVSGGKSIQALSEKDGGKLIANIEKLHEQKILRTLDQCDLDYIVEKAPSDNVALALFPHRPMAKLLRIPEWR